MCLDVPFLKFSLPRTLSHPLTNLPSESSPSIRSFISFLYSRVLMPVLLLEFPSQPLRCSLAVSLSLRVAATILTLGDDALDLFLPPLRRRHFSRVLFPPFCPPVLEPYLESQTNPFVGNLSLLHSSSPLS